MPESFFNTVADLNFQEHLFYRTPTDDCFRWYLSENETSRKSIYFKAVRPNKYFQTITLMISSMIDVCCIISRSA